jgi:predicted PurR-regulated permease PerM
VPHVIEPSLGVDRTVLAVLTSAYTEDNLGGEKRVYLKFKPAIAPVKAAVFPLLKNKPELVEKAREIYLNLKKEIPQIMWDDNGNIGKRYRRQDEIGTPWCITVDFDTLGENADLKDTVTLRDRDTGEQKRVAVSELPSLLLPQLRCKMSEMKNISVTITPGTIFMVLVIGVLAAVLFYIRDLVLIVLTAIVIASAMEPAIKAFTRRGVARILAVIAMYLLVASVFFTVVFFFVPPVLSDAATFIQKLPDTLTTLNISDATHGLLPWGSVADTVNSGQILQNLAVALTPSAGGAFATLSAVFGGITSFLLIVVFSFYFSVQETGVDNFLRVVTPIGEQAYVLHLWKRSQEKIGKWMQGQLILAVIVGVLLYLGLTILGVPHALLLAVLAGVFELIPVFGQILAAIPGVALAFTAGGVKLALLTIGLYILIQQFEAHLIYPVVVKKVVGVPPLMVILALLIGFKLVGFLGVLLSVPIAGALQEFFSDVDREKTRAIAQQLAKQKEGE